MSLTKEQAGALKPHTLEVDTAEEWGDTVYVRDLGAEELEELQEEQEKESGLAYLYRVASVCICDEDGEPLFPNIAVMRKQSVVAVKKCAEAALDFMGITEEGQEDIAGNSEAILSDDSGSD